MHLLSTLGSSYAVVPEAYLLGNGAPRYSHVTVLTGSGTVIRLVFSDDGPGFPGALVNGDFSLANVGFDLVRGIVKKSLRGDLILSNDHGAVATITFETSIS